MIKTYNRLQTAFPGTEIPANVVVKAADVTLAGSGRRSQTSSGRR